MTARIQFTYSVNEHGTYTAVAPNGQEVGTFHYCEVSGRNGRNWMMEYPGGSPARTTQGNMVRAKSPAHFDAVLCKHYNSELDSLK